jgi:hypothetical protein
MRPSQRASGSAPGGQTYKASQHSVKGRQSYFSSMDPFCHSSAKRVAEAQHLLTSYFAAVLPNSHLPQSALYFTLLVYTYSNSKTCNLEFI